MQTQHVLITCMLGPHLATHAVWGCQLQANGQAGNLNTFPDLQDRHHTYWSRSSFPNSACACQGARSILSRQSQSLTLDLRTRQAMYRLHAGLQVQGAVGKPKAARLTTRT